MVGEEVVGEEVVGESLGGVFMKLTGCEWSGFKAQKLSLPNGLWLRRSSFTKQSLTERL